MRAATGFEPSDKWFGQQAVYRISMGNFLFFGSMSLALLGVKYKGDKRGQVLQQGNWMIKLVVWVLFMVLPFLFPNGLVQAYGERQEQQQQGKGGGGTGLLRNRCQVESPTRGAAEGTGRRMVTWGSAAAQRSGSHMQWLGRLSEGQQPLQCVSTNSLLHTDCVLTAS